MSYATFQGLMKSNATVRVEVLTTTQDASGGTVESYATLASDIPCLVSMTGASRDGRFEGQNNVLSGTLTGFNTNLNRSDIRLYFQTGGAVTGVYARVDEVTQIGAGQYFIAARYKIRWTQVQVG